MLIFSALFCLFVPGVNLGAHFEKKRQSTTTESGLGLLLLRWVWLPEYWTET